MSDTPSLSKPTRVRINPSRSTCEEIIRRILTTETKENGANRHFKTAMDFMTYFESLYPSGAALTKQVQRAIKSMNLAKDEEGYFLIGKTKDEQSVEKEISALMKKSDASILNLEGVQMLLLRCDSDIHSYLASLFSEAGSIRELFITIAFTSDGLLFLTKDAERLNKVLSSL